MKFSVADVDFDIFTLCETGIPIYINRKWVSSVRYINYVGTELSMFQSGKLLVKETGIEPLDFTGDENDNFDTTVKDFNDEDIKITLGFISWFRSYRTSAFGDCVLVCDCFGSKLFLNETIDNFKDKLKSSVCNL